MKKKLLAGLATALLTLAVLGLAACGNSGGGTSEATMSFGTIASNDKTLTLALESNETTGYEWTSSVEGTGIELSSDAYEQDSSEDGAVGVGGTHTFTYKGTAAGDSTITLTYQRSWETSDSDRTVTIKVTTNASGTITGYEATDSDGGAAKMA